jgi:3-hydroxyacyl-[acyl-carrier-protein] dehydratase
MTAERPPEPQKPILDIQGIQRLLPHRSPFLLVDRVMAFEAYKKLVGWKGVTMNEPFFPGHFPGKPVMPGVLILEALAQTSALLILRDMTPEERAGKVIFFMAIDGARFRKPVVPGDRLELECTLLRNKGTVIKAKGEARVDGQVCAEGEFMAMLVDGNAT